MNKTPHKEERKPKSKKWANIRWYNTKSEHVNADTGESLTIKQIQNGNYTKVHTDHFYQIEENRPIGHHHRICKWINNNNAQLSLF